MKRKDFLFLLVIALVSFYLLLPVLPSGLTAPLNDQAEHYWPQRHYTKEQLIKGELPLWNPYIFGGVPHLANPQAAVFYPLSILFYFFTMPQIFFWFILVHLILLALFFYAFLRREQWPATLAFFLTSVLTFSSFIIYQIPAGHPVSLSGYPWIFLILLFSANHPAKIGAMTLAMIGFYFSGHLQIFFIGLLLIFIYLTLNRLSELKYFFLALALTAFLAAFQILPTLEFLSQTTKLSWSALAESYSLDLASFRTLFLPARNIQPLSYLFEKYNLYFGLLPFWLFLFTLVSVQKSRRTFSAIILIITGLLISFGPKLFFYNWLFKSPLTYFRVPARFYFLTLVGILLLLGENVRRQTKLQKFLPVITLLTLFDLFSWQKDLIKPLNRPPRTAIRFSERNARIFTDANLFINKAIMLHQFNLNGYDALIPNYFIQNHYQAVLSGMAGGEKRGFPVTYLVVNRLTDFYHPLIHQWGISYFLTDRQYENQKIFPLIQKDIFVYPLLALPGVFPTEQIFPVDDLLEYSLLDKIDRPIERICYVLNAPENLPRFSNGKLFTESLDIFPEKIIWRGKITGFIWVVFTEPFYSGWRAYRLKNGHWQPAAIYRGNRALRILPVDGCSDPVEEIIQFYHPVSFYFGLAVSVLTIITLLVYYFLFRSQKFIINIT